MFSLSSQILEGVTQYLVNTNDDSRCSSENQKGPISSGRTLANIIKKNNSVTEKKTLNDYAYLMFEDKLIELNKVLSINLDNEMEGIASINDFSFVKITGKAVFHDVKQLRKLLDNFNRFGEAVTYVSCSDDIKEVKEQIEEIKKQTKNREDKNKLEQQLKDLQNIKKLAKENNLYQDEKLLSELSYFLDYGYNDSIDIQIKMKNNLFSAPLNRDYFRDNEDLLIKKYSRQTEKEFVIFGMVTQNSRCEEVEVESMNTETLKEALMDLIHHLSNIEAVYTGRLSNEVVIEPIAIYTEL